MDNAQASKLIRNVFLSFDEFERNIILERTRGGNSKNKRRLKYFRHSYFVCHRISIKNVLSLKRKIGILKV